jgi:hypothetical protein
MLSVSSFRKSGPIFLPVFAKWKVRNSVWKAGNNETLRDEHHRYSSQIFIASPFIGGSHAQAHQFYNRCHDSGFGYSFLGQSQRARKQCEG